MEEDGKEERPKLPCGRLGYQLSCIRITGFDAEEVEEEEGMENEGRWWFWMVVVVVVEEVAAADKLYLYEDYDQNL